MEFEQFGMLLNWNNAVMEYNIRKLSHDFCIFIYNKHIMN
jgi:hypothetical protein